jgi:hypothetical protein
LFARLIYYGVTQLGRNEEDVWLMVIGDLLDQWDIHKQFVGMAKPKVELFIDEIIPIGLE